MQTNTASVGVAPGQGNRNQADPLLAHNCRENWCRFRERNRGTTGCLLKPLPLLPTSYWIPPVGSLPVGLCLGTSLGFLRIAVRYLAVPALSCWGGGCSTSIGLKSLSKRFPAGHHTAGDGHGAAGQYWRKTTPLPCRGKAYPTSPSTCTYNFPFQSFSNLAAPTWVSNIGHATGLLPAWPILIYSAN